jgi:hypothetical protein
MAAADDDDIEINALRHLMSRAGRSLRYCQKMMR